MFLIQSCTTQISSDHRCEKLHVVEDDYNVLESMAGPPSREKGGVNLAMIVRNRPTFFNPHPNQVSETTIVRTAGSGHVITLMQDTSFRYCVSAG
jgi:hypothetical protein